MATLDPRLNPYRADLAAESLRGRIEAPRYIAGNPAQVVRGTADLRRAPGADQPLDTQLLSGEVVTVYDEAEGWAWVQNQSDRYVGYVESTTLSAAVVPVTHWISALRTFVFSAPDLKAPPHEALTFGGAVAAVREKDGFAEVRLGDPAGGTGLAGWVYGAHLTRVGHFAADPVETALRFLGAPYLWGGKGSLGLDCSGLVQVALTTAGIPCPRDTYMQADSCGAALPWSPGTKPARGDLLFSPDHVAIALDESSVVHANALAMAVNVESIGHLEARLRKEGAGFTGLRRPHAPVAAAG